MKKWKSCGKYQVDQTHRWLERKRKFDFSSLNQQDFNVNVWKTKDDENYLLLFADVCSVETSLCFYNWEVHLGLRQAPQRSFSAPSAARRLKLQKISSVFSGVLGFCPQQAWRNMTGHIRLTGLIHWWEPCPQLQTCVQHLTAHMKGSRTSHTTPGLVHATPEYTMKQFSVWF